MGGLLAQIRAAKGGAGGSGTGTGGEEVADSAERGVVAPPPPPPPMPMPMPMPRSLFAATTTADAAAPQGPPPDFFAQLRAKAAEKQALRRATKAEA